MAPLRAVASLALVVALVPAPVRADSKRPKVAVTDIQSLQGVSPGTVALLTDIVVTEVGRAKDFDVLGRSDIAAMLSFERQQKLLGCNDDSSCLAELGGALGAAFLVSGTVGKLGSRNRVSLVILDVKKARVLDRAAEFCDPTEDALAETVQRAMRRLVGSLHSAAGVSAPAPIAAVETRRSVNVPGWVVLGGGAAVLVGSGISALITRSRYESLSSHQADADYSTRFAAEQGGVKSAALAADVLLGVGVAAAGAGTILLLTGAGASKSGMVVVPAAGNGYLGLVGSGRF